MTQLQKLLHEGNLNHEHRPLKVTGMIVLTYLRGVHSTQKSMQQEIFIFKIFITNFKNKKFKISIVGAI